MALYGKLQRIAEPSVPYILCTQIIFGTVLFCFGLVRLMLRLFPNKSKIKDEQIRIAFCLKNRHLSVTFSNPLRLNVKQC